MSATPYPTSPARQAGAWTIDRAPDDLTHDPEPAASEVPEQLPPHLQPPGHPQVSDSTIRPAHGPLACSEVSLPRGAVTISAKWSCHSNKLL